MSEPWWVNYVPPAPHEIRRADGSAAYHCRACRAEENLRWFRGTSCPVCSKPECSAELNVEYMTAYSSGEDDAEL